LEKQKQQARETSPKMEGRRRMIRDFITLGVQGITSSIATPNVKAYTFELKLAFIFMVQQAQFGGALMEDPNLNISIFLEVCDTLKLNGVSTNSIRLLLFPFSPKDKARAWLHSLRPGLIITWEELT